MKVQTGALALLAMAVASPTTAEAATIVFTTTFSGANEVPPVATPGTGTATVTLDDVTNMLTVQLSFSGLLSPTVQGHLHCCAPPGSNAPVASPVPTFPGFPLGVTSGSYSGMFDLTSASSFNPTFITNNGGTVASARQTLVNGMLAGNTYLNIHTAQFPGGEIRGQLAAVPEPATWAMMIGGFGMVGGAMRHARRRRRIGFASA